MLNRVFVFLIIACALTGCSMNGSGVWRNDHIDEAKKNEIKALDGKLYTALFSSDTAAVKKLLSDTLFKSIQSNIPQLLAGINLFKPESYRLGDEFYIKNTTDTMTTALPSEPTDSTDRAYALSFFSLNKEMYASQIIAEGKTSALMILAIYGKYETGWKINILRVGQYSLDHKTAPEYFALAKASYQRSELIDAVNNAKLTDRCLTPGGQHLHYKIENDAKQFLEKVRAEANAKWTLPYKLDRIKSSPAILAINPELTDRGVSVIVHYLSSINLKDSIALTAEYEKIKPEVRRIFNGVDRDKKELFYRVYNEIPDGSKAVEWYTFVEVLPAKPTGTGPL